MNGETATSCTRKPSSKIKFIDFAVTATFVGAFIIIFTKLESFQNRLAGG